MKVIVDQDLCIGCGACEATCPDVFLLNDDDVSEVYNEPEAMTDELQAAVDGCPVGAISIEE